MVQVRGSNVFKVILSDYGMPSFECPICYQNRRAKMTLECDHFLCKECWKKWSKREQFYCEHMVPVCPTCRHPQGLHQQPPMDYRVLALLVLVFLWIWQKNEQIKSATPA